MIGFDIGLDLFPMLAATLAAVTCGLLGNFLVLRRLSLMGDAISHSVLPGLVIAFLVASSRSPLAMLAGAAVAGVVTVVLVELVKKLGRVEPGAAMGVVFSVLFALGVLLIERAAVRHVDLDADCVLHGQLETLVWYGAPDSLAGLLSPATLDAVPRQVTVLAVAAIASVLFVGLLFKELRIAAFDPALASSQGFSATALHFALMVFVAGATVASFEAVGSILVIAMLVCPAATARLLTDRLSAQLTWSVAVAAGCGVVGYLAASAVPAAFGRDAVNAAGSMAVVAGAVLALAIIASPRHGVVTRQLRRRALARRVALDDVLAALFRAAETGREPVEQAALASMLPGTPVDAAAAELVRRGLAQRSGGGLGLSEEGRAAAARIVRRHRLWEHYLVEQAGLAPDPRSRVRRALRAPPPASPGWARDRPARQGHPAREPCTPGDAREWPREPAARRPGLRAGLISQLRCSLTSAGPNST